MVRFPLNRREAITGAMAGLAVLGLSSCTPRRRAPDDLAFLDITALGSGYRSGAFSPVDATNACLARIERHDGALNTFCHLARASAQADAQRAAAAISRGRAVGPLHGVPVAVKDNIAVMGIPTRAASGALDDLAAATDAECVRRLRGAGAIILGKLNMHELALGTTSATSYYGPVRNPWNRDFIAGGSSGGCAAAVAAGFCFGALGTDTGGSIRIPAAACGIVGLKPTHGLVSLDGVILVSASHDHVGPMCRTVGDAALMLKVLCDCPDMGAFDLSNAQSVEALRVGILQDTDKYCDGAALTRDVRSAFETAVRRITPLVAETGAADVPYPDLGPIIDLEAAPFHRTLDLSKLQPQTRLGIEEELALAGFDQELLLDRLARFRADFAGQFPRFDLVVTPTVPAPAMRLSDAGDPFAFGACTFAFSLAGAPAISVPCGFSTAGLPIGLMIAGPPGADATVLTLAAAYEAAAGWKVRRPPL